jgi:catechol 2,3-dioxygenase-like lactoylglutathione lyase family enzyme
MAHGFHHVHIKSPNPRKTAQWWADVFEARVMPEHGLFCPVELDGVLINISGVSPEEAEAMAQGTAEGNFGLEHVGLTTDDLDADLARLREHGLDIYVLRDTPTMRMAFVETPDNVRVELIQPIS